MGFTAETGFTRFEGEVRPSAHRWARSASRNL